MSPIELITNTYPDYNWNIWEFKHIPRNYWLDINNQRKYMKWLGERLNIKKLDDWYKVSVNVTLTLL